MKKFNFLKSLLVLIGVLITSINTAWAGDLCGFCDKAEVTDAVYIKYSKNGGSATQQNLAGSGQGDITLGTVTSLTITEFRGITKKHDGNVCAVRLYYKTATTGDIEIGSDNYKSAEYNNSGYPDWTWDSYWLCEQYKNSSVGLNILNGLAPGSYWFNFYFSIYGNNNSNSGCWDHQAYWSNGSKNYHMSFTVPSKNLTVAGAANGNTVSGDQTGISSGTAYTITATPAPGYKFNGWTATSGSSSISIADASSATTTVTFNNYANDATVTASFVRTYAFIEGRFHVWNESRSGAWTNSFGNNEDWSHVSTNIQFEYNPTDHIFYRHTYATPAELTSQISDLNPYFYVKTSTSTDDVTTHYAACYWSSTDQTLSSAGTKLSLIHDGSLDDDNLRFNNSSDNTGYVVLYFNESKIWYELEQTLTYNGNGNTAGSAPSGTYVERTKSVTAASKPGALAKSGYDFGGWNEANDGSGTNYTAGSSSITMGSTNKTVYAKWTQSVTLNSESGTGASTNVTLTYNSASHLAITNPKKAGYLFAGWYTSETAGNGSGTLVINTAGELQANVTDYTGAGGIWTRSGDAPTLYAKWINLSDVGSTCWDGSTYKCGDIPNFNTPKPTGTTSWSTSANWGGGDAPSLTTEVVLTKAMVVDDNDAQAKSVDLATNVTLSINADAGLVVAEGITKNGLATSAGDLTLLSSSSGNAALVVGEESTTTEAGVQFYSKAMYDSEGGDEDKWVNQFIGVPLDGMTAYDGFYGTYVYEYDAVNDAWAVLGNNAPMYTFKAYNLLRKESSAGTLYMEGLLNLPGNGGTKALTLTRREADVTRGQASDYLFANSWTAPIDITAMKTDDFGGAEATIYIFNAGTKSQYSTTSSSTNVTAGQWAAIPVQAASYAGMPLTVIPSMQAFMVKTPNSGLDGDTYTLTLDYTKHVYTPATSGITIKPTRAPKRQAESDVSVVTLTVSGTTTGSSDILYMLEKEDLTTDFDNGWDGEKIMGKSFAPQLYALSDAGNMSVDAIPEMDGTILGFKAGSEDTEYTFSFKYDEDEALYLLDTEKNTYTQITNDATYTFTTSDKNAHNRFALTRRSPQIVTGVDEVTERATNVTKFIENGHLFILRDGKLYNAEGALVK